MVPTCVSGGFFKRVNVDFLDHFDEMLVRYCCPLFDGSPNEDAKRNEYIVVRPGADRELHLAPDVPRETFATVINRRYSGSVFFPRSRYFAVASGPRGNDGGTLKNELIYYSKNFENGLFLIHDAGLSGIAAGSRGDDHALGLLVFALIDIDSHCNKFIADFRPKALVDGANRSIRCVFFKIPYEIRFELIPNIFDLRMPEFQEYLVELFNNSDALPFKNYRHDYKVKTFFDCLPGLLSPVPGGGEITDEIGRHLQENGVSGLIFPSARTDVGIRMEDGKLANMRGWNFVDYRGFEPIGGVVDARTREILDFEDDIVLSTATRGKYQGSWDLEGLQSRYCGFDWKSLSAEQATMFRAGIEKFLAEECS